MPGRPIAIVLPSDEEGNHSFHLDKEALEEVLSADKIKDKHIVVVSIAGAFRKGKSFLLDFLLRFLNAQGSTEWLGDRDEPLRGFPWRGGSERDTTGILVWSEVFPVTLPGGEEVVILLMDTQGAFDSQSTVKDCATVFALSTMISSVQVYNLSQNIQEDDLQHLQLFTEYGRLALEDSNHTPFQKLQFLVRDWSFPYDAPYGTQGGKQILDRRLQVGVSDKQHPELQSLRKHIRSCFCEISCFLMPHPGLKVATNQHFDGRLSDIEPDFIQHLEILVPMLLAPENLIIKEISGNKVKAKELVTYFEAYMNIYKGSELPEPKSMLEATAEANNLSAVAAAKEVYTQMMEAVCGGDKPFLSSEHLEAEHLRAKDRAGDTFHSRRKMGGEEFSERYHEGLMKDVEDQYVQYQGHNESKNVFKAARTPSVLLSISLVFYILSGVFSLVGLYALANVCNLLMMLLVLTVGVWAYSRYSGEYVELAATIDELTEQAWQTGLKPLYEALMQKSLDAAARQALQRQTSSPGTSRDKAKAS
ncbi:atlastin-like isoform X3 [Pollicipes pollicipes]|nr:atlastin-like isoform X3 [Pollicipes pollicipes]XP_037072130.1 atlastin-like isoform X3 [Pollicipes pollicipes]